MRLSRNLNIGLACFFEIQVTRKFIDLLHELYSEELFLLVQGQSIDMVYRGSNERSPSVATRQDLTKNVLSESEMRVS